MAGLGLDHEQRQEIYREARAPVNVIFAELDEPSVEGSSSLSGSEDSRGRKEKLSRLRHAMRDAVQHLFATMNRGPAMGTDMDGVVQVDFHGLHVGEVRSLFIELVAPVVPVMPVRIITGKGKHSTVSGVSKLREQVLQVAGRWPGFQSLPEVGAVLVRLAEMQAAHAA